MQKFLIPALTGALLAMLTVSPATGVAAMDHQEKNYSVQESDAAVPVLPELLTGNSGRRITDAAAWEQFRRHEVLELLSGESYGRVLPAPDRLTVVPLEEDATVFNGIAKRRQVKICAEMKNGRSFSFVMLLYIPAAASEATPVPAFAGLNFKGNHNTTSDPGVVPSGGSYVEPDRGVQSHRWCFEEVVRRGYASATVCYHDLFPDRYGKEAQSVFSLFYGQDELHKASTVHSVIGAWAWGLSRIKEALQMMPEIAPEKILVHGHSRLGKAALWAGAVDREFAGVIANNSGCGGAALHKRKFGENLSRHFDAHIRRGMPVWFNMNLRKYINKEELLPFDSHMLLALIAPRLLCIASATEDLNADPKGEFMACAAASPVYELYGYAQFPGAVMPEPGSCIPGAIHYHLRRGRHDQTPEDWAHYLKAADDFFNNNPNRKAEK